MKFEPEPELTPEEKKKLTRAMEDYLQFDAYKNAAAQNKKSMYLRAKADCMKRILEKRKL